MRVALVLERFDPRRGGLETWAGALAAWLARSGHEVHVVAFEVRPETLPPGAVAHSLSARPSPLARAGAVAAHVGRLAVEVVHDMGVGWRFDVLQPHAGSRRASFRRAWRALPPLERLRTRLSPARIRRHRERAAVERRQYAPGPGWVVAVSRMVRADLIRDHGVAPDRIDVIPNGVDPLRFSPDHQARHRAATRARLSAGAEVVFLFVAHNFRLKGLEPSLRALARLRRDGLAAQLWVLGSGPAEAFAPLVARLGLAAAVRFCGGVDDPVPFYAGADVLLHPTFYDSCSLAVLEAWASALPVVTTRFDGAHELSPATARADVLDDPGDVGALAAAMRGLLDPGVRAARGAAGRALALRHGSEENFARIAALYARVVAERSRSAAATAS